MNLVSRFCGVKNYNAIGSQQIYALPLVKKTGFVVERKQPATCFVTFTTMSLSKPYIVSKNKVILKSPLGFMYIQSPYVLSLLRTLTKGSRKANPKSSFLPPIVRWMDVRRVYVLFNNISVISGRWVDDNGRLCAMKPRLRLRRFRPQRGSNPYR